MLSNRVLLVFFLLPLAAVAEPPPSVSPAAACRSSFYPKLCIALLSPLRFPSNQYEYGRYSVKQALKQARRTATILDRYLSGSSGGARAHRSVGGGGALEDCRELAGLNAGYLAAVQAELGRGARVLDAAGVGRVRALMSAVVTNQQTCYDGLEASQAFPELRGALADQTQLYGVSLGLVTTALVRRAAPGIGTNAGSDSRTGSTGEQSSPPKGFPAIGRILVEGGGEIVPVNPSQSVKVAKDGSGNFTTVADAVLSAPNDTYADGGYFAIYIGEGVYHENVIVPINKKNLILIGSGINRTIITSNHNVADGWTTFNCATFAVNAERFIAVGITFENSAGPGKYQAVAVRNSGDLSIFYRCSFLGYQDTLYVHSLRQFYRDCDIYGTVDFIFGNAASVFQDCNIYARRPLRGQSNVVTAQGRTMPDQATGISIHNCTVSAAPDLAADPRFARTFLGRPWKEYSRTVYMQSFIDGVVDAAGWLEWNGSFALSTLYYGEYGNYGPGANTSCRVKWPGYNLMNSMDALNFTVYNFTAAVPWLSSTSVPYSGGLL
ncbi:pectinesterase pectinesterase inhibitor [Musa troglodytarum]|uniref:Pectinesterase n=1 Tax=Musa troglodytarum TaxID=320322 RepID=A0A9E7HQU5_9LILI|nr:pectinesterase pectinesterase inhibitor [Musa troglodytarum]